MENILKIILPESIEVGYLILGLAIILILIYSCVYFITESKKPIRIYNFLKKIGIKNSDMLSHGWLVVGIYCFGVIFISIIFK